MQTLKLQENLMSQKMKHLWDNYRSTLFSTFPDLEYRETWARWEGKDTSLIAKTYSNDYFIKAREVDIWSDKSSIYNNIIYPKTGSNLPCFGMDLMGFFEKKIIIVFDFQHPKENILSQLTVYLRVKETIVSLNQVIISLITFTLQNALPMK